MAVKPIPDGYHTVTPYLTVPDVDALMAFLKRAFGAAEVHRLAGPDGSAGHAEVRIGDSIVMLGKARGEWAPMPCTIYLYVEDTDAVYARALQAGATSLTEPADQFYGDRNAGVQDPAGNRWWIATHKEDLSPEDLQSRSDAFAKAQAGG